MFRKRMNQEELEDQELFREDETDYADGSEPEEYYDYSEEPYYDDYDEEYDDEYYDGYDQEYGDEFDDEYETRPKTLGRTVLYMIIILLISLVFAIALWFAADDVLALTKPDNEITITVSEGDTLEDVAQNLKDHGLVNYKFLFVLYGKFSHAEEKISTGTFNLNQMFDYHALVNGMVATGSTRQTITLTFPEGFSMGQMFAMLEENGVCDVAALEETAANYTFEYDFLLDIPYGDKNRLEGFLFPDTYEFYLDDDAPRVIKKLLNNFNSKFTDDMLADIESLNQDIRRQMEEEGSFSESEIQDAMMNPYKIITVASLIEKEAGTDSERGLISSVIYNRLTTRVHELLQIDATVEYALGEHKSVLTQSDLSVDSPYNTYLYEGLPPGPIANPGISSIMAAIYPEDSEYFFYVLNDNGSHDFFATYMEQQDFLNAKNGHPDEVEPEVSEEPATEESVPMIEPPVENPDGEEEETDDQET